MNRENVMCIYMCVCVCVCVRNGILTVRKDSLPFLTPQMDLEGIMLSEISQTEKHSYHMCNLKKARLIQTVLIGDCQGLGAGKNGEMLVKGYKFPVKK